MTLPVVQGPDPGVVVQGPDQALTRALNTGTAGSECGVVCVCVCDERDDDDDDDDARTGVRRTGFCG